VPPDQPEQQRVQPSSKWCLLPQTCLRCTSQHRLSQAGLIWSCCVHPTQSRLMESKMMDDGSSCMDKVAQVKALQLQGPCIGCLKCVNPAAV